MKKRKNASPVPTPQAESSIPQHKEKTEQAITVLLALHNNFISMIKTVFIGLFIFISTPILVFADKDLEKFKDQISYITESITELMFYGFVFIILYSILVSNFRIKKLAYSINDTKNEFLRLNICFGIVFLIAVASVSSKFFPYIFRMIEKL